MFGLGPMEVGIIVVVLLLIFGPRQIPKIGTALGETAAQLRGIGSAHDEGKDDA